MRKGKRWILSGLMVALMAITSACGGGGTGPNTSTPGGGSSGGTGSGGGGGGQAPQGQTAPRAGGTVVISKVHDADSLDPHTSSALVSREIYNMMYDRLVYIDTFGRPQPWLAESWTMNDDGTEIVFKLVDGLKFHDDTPVNAEAIKYTFDRMMDPARNSSAATQFTAIDRVEVEDELTVKFVMNQPFGPIFNSLASAFGAIISPTAAEKHGADFGSNPVGSGPFKFVSWNPGTEIVFEKNANYRTIREDVENKGAPHVDKIVIKVINESGTRINAVMTGDVHIGPVALAQAGMAEADPNINLAKQEKGFNINYLEFNMKKAPFDDLQVRKAAGYAIDAQEIIDTVYFGYASRSQTLLPTGVAGHNADIGKSSGYEFNPEKAKELLDAAGWAVGADGIREKNGQKLEVELLSWTSTEVDRLSQLIQDQLRAVGFNVKINLMEAGTFLAKGKEGIQHFDWMRTTWAEPIILSRALANGGNFNNFNHPAFQALLDEAAATVDWDKRVPLLDEAQKMLLDEALAIPMFTDHVVLMVRKEVHEFRWDALGWELLNDMWVDAK